MFEVMPMLIGTLVVVRTVWGGLNGRGREQVSISD